MRDDYETMFYLPAGSIAAIVLGMALVPLREYTNSANFIFAFMVLIIVVAEFGGRGAALATAACSALSLDFFLTRPYLSLRIEGKHDVIAFAGLSVCGLVAAAVGSRRAETVAALKEARAHIELLHFSLGRVEEGDPDATRPTEVLCALRETLPLAGAVLRNVQGDVVAASDASHAARPVPTQELQPDTLLPQRDSGLDLSRGGRALSAEGGRLPLSVGGRRVGWLDFWGNGAPASLLSRRTFVAVARLLASMMGR